MLSAIVAGASGYLLKQIRARDLVTALEAVGAANPCWTRPSRRRSWSGSGASQPARTPTKWPS